MAVFTTWTALLQVLLDQLASGNFRVASHTLNTGTTIRTVQYQTLDELRNTIEWVRLNASTEAGSWSPRMKAANVRPRQ